MTKKNIIKVASRASFIFTFVAGSLCMNAQITGADSSGPTDTGDFFANLQARVSKPQIQCEDYPKIFEFANRAYFRGNSQATNDQLASVMGQLFVGGKFKCTEPDSEGMPIAEEDDPNVCRCADKERKVRTFMKDKLNKVIPTSGQD